MKYLAAIAALGLALSASVYAQEQEHVEEAATGPEVVEINERGQATKVRIGDKVYDICVGERQDSCINPRDAGLDFGNRELDYWPGKPGSEFDGPIPPVAPEAVDTAVDEPPGE